MRAIRPIRTPPLASCILAIIALWTRQGRGKFGQRGRGSDWIEASFSDDDAGARLTLNHIALLSLRWDEHGRGAVGVGWDTGFLGLALHIDAPDEPKVDEEAFVVSPLGKAFIAGSSDRWASAAIADGADADAARASARRRTAFYTGETAQT